MYVIFYNKFKKNLLDTTILVQPVFFLITSVITLSNVLKFAVDVILDNNK